MKPPVEKMFKNFENWPSNRNFCSPYKSSETSKQKSRKCVFRPFLEAKKSGDALMDTLLRPSFMEKNCKSNDQIYFLSKKHGKEAI